MQLIYMLLVSFLLTFGISANPMLPGGLTLANVSAADAHDDAEEMSTDEEEEEESEEDEEQEEHAE